VLDSVGKECRKLMAAWCVLKVEYCSGIVMRETRELCRAAWPVMQMYLNGGDLKSQQAREPRVYCDQVGSD